MKKIIIGFLVILISTTFYFAYPIWINPKSPKGEATINKDGLNIEIKYSRPSKRDRLIFGTEDQGALLTYGKYWRLGANAPTIISINKAVRFGGKELKLGKYSMYAIPNEKFWDIRLNSKINSSGYIQPESLYDELSLSVPVYKTKRTVEQLTIGLSDLDSLVEITIEWDNNGVMIPVLD